MKTFDITPLHMHGGLYNGNLFFLVDGRLMKIGFGTPAFNDYNAWKLNELTIQTKPFEEDTTDFTPLDIAPFTVTEQELAMMDLLFSDIELKTDEECNEFERQVHELEASIDGCVHPYRYLDDPLLISIDSAKEGLFHILHKPVNLTGSDWEGEEDDLRIFKGQWENKDTLLHSQGFYNFLIPVIESLAEHYELDNKSHDVFI